MNTGFFISYSHASENNFADFGYKFKQNSLFRTKLSDIICVV